MIYLDYSATTPVNKLVLDEFNNACLNYIANPNSMHKLGILAHEAIDDATLKIASLLKVKPTEIIYTSGASESNNLAIKGVLLAKNTKGRHIVTSSLEHSSVIGPISYLQRLGYTVDFVKLDNNGLIDLEHFKTILTDDTALVSIASVNSEIGIVQQVDEIGRIIKNYPNCFFHVDVTQSIGKHKINLTNIDLASLSAQKFYGLKGIGLLIKKDNVMLEPLIHGGKSTTIYRSGTPALPLILSLAKAMELAYSDLDVKYRDVVMLNDMIKKHIVKYQRVRINSNKYCLPHILNVSILGIPANKIQKEFEKYDIYLSTQTACSLDEAPSTGVYALTKDVEAATSSIRISLSYLTKEEEINTFLDIFDKVYNGLVGYENS